MKSKLYLVLYDILNKRQFTKYFDNEHLMDKFKQKLRYSKKLIVVEDSRDTIYDYEK